MSRQSRSARLPRDTNSAIIQCLSAETDAAVLTAGGASARVAVPAECLVVEIVTLTAVHFRFGDSTVAATAADRLLPAGAVVVYTVPEIHAQQLCTHVAFLKVSGASDGLCSVAAMR
jgi:hypothetical protein